MRYAHEGETCTMFIDVYKLLRYKTLVHRQIHRPCIGYKNFHVFEKNKKNIRSLPCISLFKLKYAEIENNPLFINPFSAW